MKLFEALQKIKVDGEKISGKIVGIQATEEQTTIYFLYGKNQRIITVESEAVTFE